MENWFLGARTSGFWTVISVAFALFAGARAESKPRIIVLDIAPESQADVKAGKWFLRFQTQEQRRAVVGRAVVVYEDLGNGKASVRLHSLRARIDTRAQPSPNPIFVRMAPEIDLESNRIVATDDTVPPRELEMDATGSAGPSGVFGGRAVIPMKTEWTGEGMKIRLGMKLKLDDAGVPSWALWTLGTKSCNVNLNLVLKAQGEWPSFE